MASQQISNELTALFKAYGFGDEMPPKVLLAKTDALIEEVTKRLLARVGQGQINFRDLVFQGGGGSTGPHRLDLLLRYSTEVADGEVRRESGDD